VFKTTIESVISDITTKIDKLRRLAAEHHQTHLIHIEESIRHTDVANDQALKRDKAFRIADKFDELLK
jgi:hypothetical protein